MVKVYIKEIENGILFTKQSNRQGFDYPFDLSDEEYKEFKSNYELFILENGQLIKDINRNQEHKLKHTKEELRRKRKEVFNIINRGKLWYDSLSEVQEQELNEWYDAWLKVTETLVIPLKPIWLI